MSVEIELKFSVTDAVIHKLPAFFAQYPVKQEQSLYLLNTYYETKDLYLRSHGCGLRLRVFGESTNKLSYEITMKREGQSIGGLHQRQEFNAVSTSELDISRLPMAAFPDGTDLVKLQQALTALFTTHFQRHIWLVQFNDSEIEVALDRGEVATAHNAMPFKELELELKYGNEQDLFEFAIQLCPLGVRLAAQSKAARGYRLVANKVLTMQVLPQLPSFIPTSQQWLSHLQTIVAVWQNNEEFALENNQLSLLSQTLLELVAQLQTIVPQLSHLNPAVQCVPLISAIDWIEQAESVEQLAYSPNSSALKLYLTKSVFDLSKAS